MSDVATRKEPLRVLQLIVSFAVAVAIVAIVIALVVARLPLDRVPHGQESGHGGHSGQVDHSGHGSGD